MPTIILLSSPRIRHPSDYSLPILNRSHHRRAVAQRRVLPPVLSYCVYHESVENGEVGCCLKIALVPMGDFDGNTGDVYFTTI